MNILNLRINNSWSLWHCLWVHVAQSSFPSLSFFVIWELNFYKRLIPQLWGINFNSFFRDCKQTEDTVLNIKYKCFIFIVLWMKNKNKPSSTCGNNKHCRARLHPALSTCLCRYRIFRSIQKTSLFTPVINRKEVSSELSNKCCHAEYSGSRTAWW